MGRDGWCCRFGRDSGLLVAELDLSDGECAEYCAGDEVAAYFDVGDIESGELLVYECEKLMNLMLRSE